MTTAASTQKTSWLRPILWLLTRTVGMLAVALAMFVFTGGAAGVPAFAMLLILAIAFFPSRILFPERDEVQKRAEYFGLKYGTATGAVFAIVTARFFDALGFWRRLNDKTQITDIWTDELDILFTGMLHLTICAVIGSYLFRIGWWISKR